MQVGALRTQGHDELERLAGDEVLDVARSGRRRIRSSRRSDGEARVPGDEPAMTLGLASWIEIVGAIVAIVATSLGIVATVGGWIKRSIGHMIDDKLTPIYQRLDEHMSAEDESLAKIAEAMKRLAESWDQN